MSYLLAQIFLCLLAAGLIGALIGWWFRGGCRNKLKQLENDWATRYDSDKAVWQGKIDAAENHIQKSIHQNNDEWDLRLRDAESSWEGKVQGLVGNYDSELKKVNLEKQALEDELEISKRESKEARLQLASMDEKWNLKLKDVESSWEDKIQGVVSNYDSKAGSSDAELKELRAQLDRAKAQLKEKDEEWNLKLKDVESKWENKLKTEEVHLHGSEDELKALKEELKLAKKDAEDAELKLTQLNDEWTYKLKDVESSWEDKVQGVVSNYDSKVGSSDAELKELRAQLDRAKAQLKEKDEEWNLKLKDVESTWEDKIKTAKDEAGNDGEIKALKEKLAASEMKLNDVNDSWGVKLKDVESSWEGKLQGVMSDFDSKSGNKEQEVKDLKTKLEVAYAKADDSQKKLADLDNKWAQKLKDIEDKSISSENEIKALKSELESAKGKLEAKDNEWNLKLKDTESSWQGKLQGLMSDYDSKITKSEKEHRALKETLGVVKAEADEAKAELIQADVDLFGAIGNLEESYDITAIEGIGPGYGKKFSAMGINTTDDFAKRFLNNEKEIKKASSETNIDVDAIRSWASMADLMKLPGVDGQYAEIMQVVGVDSRDELTKINPKTLHSKMIEYNAKNPIVPEVPSLPLLIKWTKSPDNKKIRAALSSAPTLSKNMDGSYDIEEIEGIGPSYGKKLRAMGISTTADFSKSFLNNEEAVKKVSAETGITVNAIRSWAIMADIMSLPGVDGQYAEILQAVGVSSKESIKNFNPSTLHQKMQDYNSKHSIVPEIPSLELLSTLTGKSISDDNESKSAKSGSEDTDLNECYEIEEVEGIGPGYGKRLRKLGINTTCDLANNCLRDNKATKKISKSMQVDFDAVRAWASMADLMRLPGVGGQYAEIMQTCGVGSRKELTQTSVNSFKDKMEEFNTKNPIVPEVPTVDMLVEWANAAKKQH